MMRDAIKNFNKQFAFEPVIEFPNKFSVAEGFVVVGMGGSHLAADLLKIWQPDLDLYIHSDYGLPPLPAQRLRHSLIILSSYSGNTEEVLDAYEQGLQAKLNLLVIAAGGKLITKAKADGVSHILLPATGIQPRSALGYSLRAFLLALGEEGALKETRELEKTLKPEAFESAGKELAVRLKGFVPVIYASSKNGPLAYNWKIKFNETGKIPAFFNLVPELNHNEMTGFDVKDSTRELSRQFKFLLLKDVEDEEKNQKRMEILESLYRARGLSVEAIQMKGRNIFEKMFNSLLLADWTALHIAEQYGLEAEQVPMVEEFKKLIA